MTPASKLLAQRWRASFAEEVARPEDSIRLDRAALMIGAEDEAYKNVDVEGYLSRLDGLGEIARERIDDSTGAGGVEAFNHFMFEEMGFAGNQLDYYDPRNSFLNDVIDRRRGIPITLSILYMEVGRRAGLKVEGIGLPSHFIVRALCDDASAEATLVDPFHGATLSLEDCQDRLDTIYDGQVLLTEEHLRAATNREILARMLTNLKMIYAQAKTYRQALAAVERIQLVTPGAIGEHRDRASLLMQLDRLAEAISETEIYLRLAPGAPDANEARERLHLLQRQQAMRN
ncbi:MAG: transglutaminase-like domain-containing protein [Pyrinomonadaceae bacterium]